VDKKLERSIFWGVGKINNVSLSKHNNKGKGLTKNSYFLRQKILKSKHDRDPKQRKQRHSQDVQRRHVESRQKGGRKNGGRLIKGCR